MNSLSFSRIFFPPSLLSSPSLTHSLSASLSSFSLNLSFSCSAKKHAVTTGSHPRDGKREGEGEQKFRCVCECMYVCLGERFLFTEKPLSVELESTSSTLSSFFFFFFFLFIFNIRRSHRILIEDARSREMDKWKSERGRAAAGEGRNFHSCFSVKCIREVYFVNRVQFTVTIVHRFDGG